MMGDAPVDPALFAAVLRIVAATHAIADATDESSTGADRTPIRVEISQADLRTLAAAFDLICLALRTTESSALH